eukprot:7658365-Alexandrium_andersonii.AAC.1
MAAPGTECSDVQSNLRELLESQCKWCRDQLRSTRPLERLLTTLIQAERKAAKELDEANDAVVAAKALLDDAGEQRTIKSRALAAVRKELSQLRQQLPSEPSDSEDDDGGDSESGDEAMGPVDLVSADGELEAPAAPVAR